MIEKIEGFDINFNENTSRIIDIDIKEEILNKLIFPFNKFDITSLEYKPFTRFTIANNLDNLTNNKLSNLLNKILKDRNFGCFICSLYLSREHIDIKSKHPFIVKNMVYEVSKARCARRAN